MSNENQYYSQKEQTADKMKAAIGANIPTAFEAIRREDYANDDQYIDALAAYDYERESADPRLKEIRRKYARLVMEQNEEKRREKQQARYAELKAATQLSYEEQQAVDKAAADAAVKAYNQGYIEAADVARATTSAAEKYKDAAISRKAGSAFLNELFREEYKAQKGISPSAEKKMSDDVKRDLMGKDKAW